MANRISFLRALSKRSPLAHPSLLSSSCLSPSPLLLPSPSLFSSPSLSYSTAASQGKRRTWVKPPKPIIVDAPTQFPALDGEEQCPPYLREIGDSIMNLNVKEIDEFCVYLFEKDTEMEDDEADKIFKSLGAGTTGGVGPMTVAQAGAPEEAESQAEEPKAEKTIFKLQLTSIDDFDKNKLKVIKAIRTIKPGEPLDKSKSYVTSMPSIILDEVPKDDALKHQEELAKVGAKLELV
mmetsp:Transcript_6372/g.9653  ORF Transcript_6372/g.9653 Transcript_6372/m.9653 type:complete len:236 (-) Transcript_6372:9-716(-)|eukprot:CAMPEP_0201511278 /NCGR_PEP_ID=MMETSP0161_2-20130828/3754_1 /ASSEMBLY_ACC=CAM_ASM_000251 /TAXON_ID=180227 /ORGANISM="Neoparamoeba aestuarina, Strain SoJaBio B1-5/56/2" /LENGTH=235 /DNA_ID=CAMNT_0047906703 /DNA_START=58 /DNA_END=765 /DNA_ORIENTATION=+